MTPALATPANRNILGSSQTSNSGQRTHHRRTSEVHRRTLTPDLKEWSSNVGRYWFSSMDPYHGGRWPDLVFSCTSQSISWTLRGVSRLFQGYVGESATGEREYQLFHSEVGDGRYHLDLGQSRLVKTRSASRTDLFLILYDSGDRF